MTRRTERIVGTRTGTGTGTGTRLPWSGTFHSIAQSADSPPRRRGRTGCPASACSTAATPPTCRSTCCATSLRNREALPAQGHVPRHLFASRQHAAAARGDARCDLSVVRRMGIAAHRALSRICGQEARESGARLRRPAPLLARDDDATSGSAADIGGEFDHVLVDEYQDTNVLQARILKGLRRTATASPWSETMRRRSTRSGRDRRQHPGFPGQYVRENGASVITLEDNYRSTQAVLDAANALIAEGAEAVPQGAAHDRGRRACPVLRHGADDQSQAEYVVARAFSRRARAASASSARRCSSGARTSATRSSSS